MLNEVVIGHWLRTEIESAFECYEQVVVEIGTIRDWSCFADQFTKDATYVEHTYGTFHEREQIRDWIVSTMDVFTGSEMPFYPTSWYSSTRTAVGYSAGSSIRYGIPATAVSTRHPTCRFSSTPRTICGDELEIDLGAY